MSETKTRQEMLIDEKWFSTPDMGEYLNSAMIQKAAEELSNGEIGGEFFIEKPFSTDPGYYPSENVIIISGKPSLVTDPNLWEQGYNKIDADTIYLGYDEIIANESETVDFLSTEKTMTITELLRRTSESTEDSDLLGLRLIGINAPEIVHYRTIKNPNVTIKCVAVKYKDLLADGYGETKIKTAIGEFPRSSFNYVKYNTQTPEPSRRDPEEVLLFTYDEAKNEKTNKKEKVFFEVISPTISHPSVKINKDNSATISPQYGAPSQNGGYYGEKLNEIRICLAHGTDDNEDLSYFSDAIKAQKTMYDLIGKADEVIYMLDQSYLAAKVKGELPFELKKEYEKISANPFYAFRSLWNNLTKEGASAYQQLGKRYFGQELNGRYLAACYVKINTSFGEQWINVAKYMIHHFPNVEALPSYSNSGADDADFSNVSDAFKLWTYNKSKANYLDAINALATDDREHIQKSITGLDLNQLTNHTVMLGDVLLMVPPTSIRSISQVKSDRISLLRSKGGLTRTLPKTERLIEMQVYFNGDEAINGVPYIQSTPNGQQMTYYMNGLRALLSQFKFTPFVPVTNDYINYVLNIEAVSLVGIQISTIPNYPRTLQATITLQEFDYGQYMPELLPPDLDKGQTIYTNLFSKVIHWPVFRYYYQRAIHNGEALDGIEFNSEEYINSTIGQKTALQRAKFMDPTFNLYLANEEHLKQRKNLKLSLERNPIESVIEFNTEEEKFLRQLASIYKEVRKVMSNNNDLVYNQMFSPADSNDLVLLRKTPESKENKKDVWKETTVGPKGQNQWDYWGISHGYRSGDTFEYSVTRKEIYDNYITKLRNNFNTAIKNLETGLLIENYNFVQIHEVLMYESAYENRVRYSIGVELTINWAASGHSGTLDKLRRLIAKQYQTTTEEIFKDKKVFIGWTAEFECTTNEKDTSMNNVLTSGPSLLKDNDYNALTYILKAFGGELNNDEELDEDMWIPEYELGEGKDNIDLETAKSIVFDHYDIGNPIINNISIGYNNIFNNMSMKIYDGYAAQYTGGTDTTVEISMTATSEYTVSKLQLLSRVCTQRLIDFRKVIASSPLRLDCELTRLVGVNEIVIESIDINTVPNYPNTWSVVMRLVSVDRTLRNREALKKLDGIDNYLTDHDNIKKVKNFFDVKNVLAKVELYPDLELPTIEELSRLGFNYIKYKNDNSRLFPDADFYFAYLHVFTSDMIRESIVNHFKNSDNFKLKQEFSGNLFEGDSALVAYDLRGSIANDSDTKSTFSTEEKEQYPYSSDTDVSFYSTRYNKDVDTLVHATSQAVNNNKESETVSNTQEKQMKKTDSQKMTDVMNSLTEAITCTNYNSYNFNTIYKVSVKDTMPFNQEQSILAGKEDDMVYVFDGTYEEDAENYHVRFNLIQEVANGNKVEKINNSLKKMILEILKRPINPNSSDFIVDMSMYKDFFRYFAKILGTSDIDQLYYNFGDINVSSNAKQSITSIFKAFARGATASFAAFDRSSSKGGPEDLEELKPKDYYKKLVNGVSKKVPNVFCEGKGQISDYVLISDNTEEEILKGVVFGRFAIKQYPASTLSNIYNGSIVNNSGFVDPYYNKELYDLLFPGHNRTDFEERIKEYKLKLASIDVETSGSQYANVAFFRIMLVWLYKMLTDSRQSLLPDAFHLIGQVGSLMEEGDELDDGWMKNTWQWIERKTPFVGLESKAKKLEKNTFSSKKQAKLEKKKDELEESKAESAAEKKLEARLEKLEKDLPRIRFSLFNGLLLTLGTLALTETSTPVYDAIVTGNLNTYIKYIEKIKGSKLDTNGLNKQDLSMRKVYQFLDYQFYTSKYNDSYEKINQAYETDIYSAQGKIERIYLEAADIPSVYLMHSFYDMVMNDMRGRMARAFPTYYMLLIDEGRDMGIWKLQDNFYDVSSIYEFQVVKSRKIAADTAKIVMTNLFGTFTTEDDDMKDEYQYTFKDMFNSIFSPVKYISKEYQRYNEARDVNRAKVRPGARVNLRMGYTADASAMPIVFNGSVAEIQEGELMTLVCQGDGVELANPHMFLPTDATDVADLEYNDSLFSFFLGAFKDNTTPRDLLINPLIAEGTWIHEKIKDWSKGRLFNANPFGIVHFGDRKMKDIFGVNGEVSQNIYESLSKPSWGADITELMLDSEYALDKAPEIKVGLQGKSYWDLMHISASVSPDFICAIAPFQMRSTIFHGAPRYYYAYDYDRLPNGQIVEKRKPFQQFHIYTSYTDILNNGITASDKDVRTVAMGVYTKPGKIVGKEVSNVGPLFLDIDIYPEKQKTTSINCNFEYKSFDHMPFTIPAASAWKNEFSKDGGYQIAWRATANGLKDTVKDMYKGELIVIGDPTVKPYDRIFINDLYEDMQGSVEVETVVHTFSVDTGFTTSITPDCIAAIDNKYEQIVNGFWSTWGAPLTMHVCSLITAAKFTNQIARGMFFSAEKALKIGGKAADLAVNSTMNVLGKDKTAALSPYVDSLTSKLGFAFGVTDTDLLVFKSIQGLEDAYNALSKASDLTSSKDIVALLDKLSNVDETLKELNPATLLKTLEDLKATDKELDIIKSAQESAKLLSKDFDNYATAIKSAYSFSKSDIEKILNSLNANAAKEAKDAINTLKELAGNGIKYGDKDFNRCLNALKKVAPYIDDLTSSSEALKVFNKLNNVTKSASSNLKNFEDLADTFKDVNKISKGAKSIKMILAQNLILLAAEIVISKSVQEMVERRLKNWQVLTVFPITKNAKVLTAGLDGNKGSVFGSPTYNQAGWLEETAIKLFENKNVAWSFIRDFFLTTEEMRATINGYKRDNGYGTISGSEDVERQASINGLLSAVAKNNISGFNAYRQLYFDDRVAGVKSTDFALAAEKYALKDLSEQEITTTKIIPKNLVYIYSNNNLIKKLSDKGVFKFVADDNIKQSTSTTSYETKKISIPSSVEGNGGSRVVSCKQMTVKRTDNTNETYTMYSIPYLRNDALIVLLMLLEKICADIQPDYTLDTCKFEYLKQHPIVLHSGVIINSEKFVNTGYCFTLEVKNYDNLSNIIKGIVEEDNRISSEGKMGYKLIEARQNTTLGKNTYNFYIAPMKA